jgi:hypothetical protein
MDPTEHVPPTLSPEVGNKSSLQNVIFLEYLIMYKVKKLSNVMHHYQDPLEVMSATPLSSRLMHQVALSFCLNPSKISTAIYLKTELVTHKMLKLTKHVVSLIMNEISQCHLPLLLAVNLAILGPCCIAHISMMPCLGS